MRERLLTEQIIQPAVANLQPAVQRTAERDPVLQGLPIETVGQLDPLNPDRVASSFPNLLYHGTKAEDFALDDSRDHRNSFVGTGANSGAGLYTASRGVSEMFGAGNVVELVPHNANLLDLGAEQAKQPLSDEFKQAYLKDAYATAAERVQQNFPNVEPATVATIWKKFSAAEGLVTKDDVREVATKAKAAGKTRDFSSGCRLADEIASQINTTRLLESLSGVSMQELFATYNSNNGETRVDESIAFKIAPIIDFLTAHGIDGAKTAQRFDGPNGAEQAVVFWKLDNVGDKATWKRRLQQAPLDIADTAISHAVVKLIETTAQTDEVIAINTANTKAEVRQFIARSGVDFKRASTQFEATAQAFVGKLHENAKADGRPLTSGEIQHIKNIVEIVAVQRQKAESI